MSMTRDQYVAQFRKNNPGFSHWTDDDVLDGFVESLGADVANHPVLAEHAQARRMDRTSFWEETKGALGAGVDMAQGKLYDTAALAGEVTGIDSLKEFGVQGRERNEAGASEYDPVVRDFESVRTPQDFAYWLANIAGTNAPQMAGTATAAAGAAALAPASIPTALAALIGGSVAGFTQMQNYGELEKLGGENVVPLAIANGLLGAALEAAGPAALVTKLTKAGVKKAAAESAAREILYRVAPAPVINAAFAAAQSGSTEMLTELLQESLTITTEVVSNRNNDSFSIDDKQIRSRLLNAGAAGLFLGGISGGAVSAVESMASAPAQEYVDPRTATIPPAARASLDPEIPPATAAEAAQAAANATAAAGATVVPPVSTAQAATPAAAPGPILASVETQQKLVALNIPAEQAMQIPEEEAQQFIADANAILEKKAAQARVDAEKQRQVQIENEARMQNQVAAQQELAAQQQGQDAQATAQATAQARVAQLRAQRNAAQNLQSTEKMQVKTGGIVGAMQEAPTLESVAGTVLPGPTLFNLAHQAQQDAANVPGVMRPIAVQPVAVPDSPVADWKQNPLGASANAVVVPLANTPAPVASPASVTPPGMPVEVLPDLTPTHGLHGLADLKIGKFIPVIDAPSGRSAVQRNTRNTDSRYAILKGEDGVSYLHAITADGRIAIRENQRSTPKSVADAVTKSSGIQIKRTMVDNILNGGKSSPRAAEVQAEAKRQGYTAPGERVDVWKFAEEKGLKFVGVVTGEKGDKMLHVQKISAADLEALVASTAKPEAKAPVAPPVTPPVAPVVPAKTTFVKQDPSPVKSEKTVVPAHVELRLEPDAVRDLVDKMGTNEVSDFVDSSGPAFDKRADELLNEMHLDSPKAVWEALKNLTLEERKNLRSVLRGDMLDALGDAADAPPSYEAGGDYGQVKSLKAVKADAFESQKEKPRKKKDYLERKPGSADYLGSDQNVAERFNIGVRELAARGSIVKIGEATSALKEGGTYVPSRRETQLVLKNVAKPTHQDLLNLLHETLHHAVESAPEWIQRAMHDTFARLPLGEKAFYKHPGADPKVSSGANVDGLSRETYLMEQAVEHATIQGVDRQFATGVIAAVWRTVKDLLLKGAMYAQGLLLGKDNVGGRLAKEWVENVAAQVIAADRTAINGFLEQFGYKPTYGQIGRYVTNRGVAGQFMSIDPKTGVAAVEFSSEISTAAGHYRANAPIDAAIESAMASGLLAASDAETDFRGLPTGDELMRGQPSAHAAVSEQIQAGIRKAVSDVKVATAVANQINRTFRALFDRYEKLHTGLPRDQILAMRKRGESVPDTLSFEGFMARHGVPDPVKARDNGIAALNARLEVERGQKVTTPEFDPEILIDQLSPVEQGLAELALEAQSVTTHARSARRFGDAEQTILALRDKAAENRAAIQEIVKNLADYKTSEKYAVRNILENLDELTHQVLPKIDRMSESVGETRAILEALDEKNTDLFNVEFTQSVVKELNVPALPLASIFRALFALEQSLGFDLADAKVSEVRQHVLDEVMLRPDSELSRLVALGEGPNAKMKGTALLTAILSFVRKEAALADTIRVQLTETESRSDRVNEIRAALNETSETRLEEIRTAVESDLKRLGNRTIFNWLKKRDELMRDQRSLAEAENTAEILRVSAPVLENARVRASSRMSVSHHITFAPGEPIFNPTDVNWTSEEVFARPHKLAVSRDKFMTSEQAREIMRNQKAWMEKRAAEPDALLDEVYRTMEAQHKQLLMAAVDKKMAMHAGMKKGAFHSLSEMLIRTGTPAGKFVARMLNNFESIKRSEMADDFRLGKAEEVAADDFAKAAKMSHEAIHESIYNQAIDYFGSERTLDRKAAFLSLRAQFLENPALENVMRDDATWAKFVRWMEVVDQNRTRMERVSVKYGNRVLDQNIQRKDPVTGKMRAALRLPIERGVMTIGRGLHKSLKAAVSTMRDRNVLLGDGQNSPFTDLTLRLRNDPQGLATRLNEFFSDGEIRQVFLDPLMTNQKASIPAPVGPDGLKITLSSAVARDAWASSNGDLLTFAKEVYLRLGSKGRKADLEVYQESVIRFVEGRMKALMRDIQTGEESAKAAPLGIPHVAMDARVGEDYPWQWVNYHRFSVVDNHMQTHTIAANAAFGRNLDDAKGALGELMTDLNRLADQMPTTDEGRQALKKKDPARFRVLNDAAQLRADYGGGELENYLKNEFQPAGGVTGEDLGLPLELFGTVVTLMLSGVKTALRDLSSLIHPLQLERSLSLQTLGTSASAFGYAGKYGMAAVLNSIFGTDLLRNDPMIRAQEAAAGGDLAREVTYSDHMKGTRGKGDAFEKSNFGAVQRGLRMFRGIVANGRIGLNQGAAGPALRANLFTFMTQVQIYASTSAYMRRAADLGKRTAEFYRMNPAKMGATVTAKDIGYGDSIGFDNLRAKLADFGVSIEALGEKIAKSKNIKYENLFDETTVQGIRSMSLDNIVLEAGPATRPAFTRGSKFARTSSALVGWSFGKTAALMDLFRDPERGASVKTVLNGAIVMTLGLLPAAIVGSLLMDEYDEELGKKANLRSFTADMGAENAAKAVLERSVQMGAFGLPGELVNAIVNPTDGAGQKVLSVDQRIVWVSSLIQMKDALSSFIAVGGFENANYANVYRPLLNSLGGSGIMQNVQLMNGILGGVDIPLFRDEAHVTARININNFLRSAGRDLGMDVFKTGAAALPSPATPWVTNMVLAALANDPEAFQKAYVGAIKAAREVPNVTDPVQYVSARFGARNPIRAVFKTTPSVQEVHQLLNRMTPEGRQAVSQGIGLINAYGAKLGIAPYFGVQGERSTDLLQAQAKALKIPRSQASMAEVHRRALAERRSGGPED